MFTVCPKCALTLVVTAADLRVAQGYVRCGRCSNVFNALARLSEDRNASWGVQRPRHRSSSATQAAAVRNPVAAPAEPPRPRAAPAEPTAYTYTATETPAPDSRSAAARGRLHRRTLRRHGILSGGDLDDDELIPEDALEFNPDAADVNKVFVEPPPNPEWTAATGTFKAIVLKPRMPRGVEDRVARTPQRARKLKGGAESRPGRHPADWRPRLDRLEQRPATDERHGADSTLNHRDRAALIGRAYAEPVRTRRPPPAPPGPVPSTRPAPRSRHCASPGALRRKPPAAAPARAAGRHGVAPRCARPSASQSAARRSKIQSQPRPEHPRAKLAAPTARPSRQAARKPQAAERPASFGRRAAAPPNLSAARASHSAPRVGARVAIGAPCRRGRRRASPTCGAPECDAAGHSSRRQIVNHYRNDLAASRNSTSRSPPSMRRSACTHTALGSTRLRRAPARCLRGLGEPGQIMVRASVKNGAHQAQPMPLLRVTLQDRFGNRIAARDVAPGIIYPAPSRCLVSVRRSTHRRRDGLRRSRLQRRRLRDRCLPARPRRRDFLRERSYLRA